MEEDKIKKIEKIEKVIKTSSKKVKSVEKWEKMSVEEMQREFQKLMMDIQSGIEKNSSLARKLRKQIAIKLTKNNQK